MAIKLIIISDIVDGFEEAESVNELFLLYGINNNLNKDILIKVPDANEFKKIKITSNEIKNLFHENAGRILRIVSEYDTSKQSEILEIDSSYYEK